MQSASNVRYSSLSWLVLAAGLAYLCRNAVGVAESTIRSDLGLTLEQSGAFMGAFFWTYAIFQIPSGTFAQSLGSRIGLTVFAVVWAVGTLAIAGSTAFWMLLSAQLAMGVAQAGLFPASCNSIGHWMPLAQRAIACGVLAAGMQVGAVMASGLTGGLMDSFGWRGVFVLFALPSVLWAIGFFCYFRNRPEHSPSVNEAELKLIRGAELEGQPANNKPESPLCWITICKSPVVWFLCGQQICRAAGYMFFASWFPTFLQETRGISVQNSGYLQGLVLAGTLAGGILGGMLADWIWQRTRNLRISRSVLGASCLATCGVLILVAWFVTSLPVAIGLLSLGSLFAALAGPCAFSATIDIGGKHVPQVFGLMNMTGNFAAASCPILVGWLFSRTENWNLVLVLFAVVYLLGALSWIFVNPAKSILKSENKA